MTESYFITVWLYFIVLWVYILIVWVCFIDVLWYIIVLVWLCFVVLWQYWGEYLLMARKTGVQFQVESYPYLPTHLLGQYMTQGQFLSWVEPVWIQSFPSSRRVASTRLKNPVCPTGGRIIGFIPFPRVLELCEMLSASSRIWTRVAVSISYDDNHYTTGTSKKGWVLSKTQKWCLIPPLLTLSIIRWIKGKVD